MSAGARLTVTWVFGKGYPEFLMAALMRSSFPDGHVGQPDGGKLGESGGDVHLDGHGVRIHTDDRAAHDFDDQGFPSCMPRGWETGNDRDTYRR